MCYINLRLTYLLTYLQSRDSIAEDFAQTTQGPFRHFEPVSV